MENLVEGGPHHFPRSAFWLGKRVAVTGHTGFKGSWLAAWLIHLGARVTGLALPPGEANSLYDRAQLDKDLDSRIADIRDRNIVDNIFSDCQPEIVIHLAAQAILRRSYTEPVPTYETNIMGTINVLEGARRCGSVRAMVMVTSDKCYENREQESPYVEGDQLGGFDPYSSSKACAELAIASWRRSFFNARNAPGVASARAGNVIGGGDWATDRLLPDCVRAFMVGKPVRLRHPDAIRPWQHVLEPLRGYLLLSEHLWDAPQEFGQAWNFGPTRQDTRSVSWVAHHAAALWGSGARCEMEPGDHPHEAKMLFLDITKAAAQLAWAPAVDLTRALEWTIAWYRGLCEGEDAASMTKAQLVGYARIFGH